MTVTDKIDLHFNTYKIEKNISILCIIKMPTFQEAIDIESVGLPNNIEIYEHMVNNDTCSEVTIPSPTNYFVTRVACNKFNFPETLNVIDIGDPSISILREEEEAVHSRLDIDFNIPHTNSLHIYLYNKNIINKDFMDLFAPHISYRYVYCSLNGTPLNIIITNLYMKYFTKKLQLHNKLWHVVYDTYTDEIYEYVSRTKQGKEFCKIIKEELVSVAFHPKRICPLIMKYGPEILDDL
jgi:hypothetical protein